MPAVEAREALEAVAELDQAADQNLRLLNLRRPFTTVTAPDTEEYRRRRRAYYDRFPEFWATFPAGTEAEEEYAVYGAIDVHREDVRELRLASERLFHVMSKVLAWTQIAPDSLLQEIGVPYGAREYARLSLPGLAPTVVGRFEYAMTREGPKLLELNAETPTLIVELFRMNGQVCRDFGLEDPNAVCEEELRGALITAIEAAGNAGGKSSAPLNVVFTSWGDHKEDRGTVEYLLRLLTPSCMYTASYCPLDQLRLTADALCDHDGRSIDVLYKLYPTEHLLEDHSPDHVPVGRMIMGLVAADRLTVINPPVSFLLQSKGLLALIWALHEERVDMFCAEEHDWLQKYMLPTYLQSVTEDGVPVFSDGYIAKPVYGREGDSIAVYGRDGVVEEHPHRSYASQTYVYQQHVALPRTSLLTEQGRREVNLVFNCFVVGGHASAVGIRTGPDLILDDNAYFVPVCYRADVSERST